LFIVFSRVSGVPKCRPDTASTLEPRKAKAAIIDGVSPALSVIPGPPQAEPGIQPFAEPPFLDSGFALTRAPE
jgi:hypothetical protein